LLGYGVVPSACRLYAGAVTYPPWEGARNTDSIRLLRFAEPAPYREIGLFWRSASVNHHLLGEVASALRDPAPGPVTPLGPGPALGSGPAVGAGR
jgi:hypothetical protein